MLEFKTTGAQPMGANDPVAGMTKREYIATAALQGILAGPSHIWSHGQDDDGNVARAAVRIADALIAELGK
jgi:hypothetical protein